MQQKNQSSNVFSERTDALAATLHVSIRELAERIGISQAMLFAYRGGKYPISEKAWKKLEAAEAAANQSSYQRKSENQSVVAENAATYGAEPARATFPSWWDRMPKSAGELEAVLPHVHARSTRQGIANNGVEAPRHKHERARRGGSKSSGAHVSRSSSAGGSGRFSITRETSWLRNSKTME